MSECDEVVEISGFFFRLWFDQCLLVQGGSRIGDQTGATMLDSRGGDTPFGLVYHEFKVKIVTLRHIMSQRRGSELLNFTTLFLVRPLKAQSVIHRRGEKHQLFLVYRHEKETQTAKSLATIMRKSPARHLCHCLIMR